MNSATIIMYNTVYGVEQITKADRNACHALSKKGKVRATLRRLSSTVIPLFY